ncbi:alpha/beta hydrolase fold domain-containing protein [Polaribacter sargassicola]|uniref:alpha/beta hydrolase fold domain-containing protein n=1 Tax=Polaribacter sargassicola TaxID=2836891 RepID=UPI001F3B97EE|nr:alpha/beta hydrolase fold domain-containing protein [Polaribacter sp. DS7-9]MCG1035779.1 alpha/beta hydrolase fold domain-containing protein [Polaribacter sp. DS7-9]
MKSKKKVIVFLLFICSVFTMAAQNIKPDKKILFKVIDGDSLYLHVFQPKIAKKPTAAIVFFFGGGWVGGNPKQFYQQSEYFASRGILAISAEYRVNNVHGTTPFECVEDGKSAIRWVREHAKELNINPNKIIAGGGSAGGHVALSTSIINGFENTKENLAISSVPNAVVAYNPVSDTTKKGYGSEKVVGRETEISPVHQLKKGLPPMLIFHGTKDKTVPFENAKRFNRIANELENDCKLVAIENVGHGFFNGDFFRKGGGNKYFNLTMYDTDIFLKKLGYLKGKPTLSRELIKIACVGDGNTKTQFLQGFLGEKHQVKNFEKEGATLIDGTNFPYAKIDEYKKSIKFNSDIILIMFGANEAHPKWFLDSNRSTKFTDSVRDEFKAEYIKLIKSYKQKNKNAQIYVLTPLLISENKNPQKEFIKEYNNALNSWVIPVVKEIVEEQGIKLIDTNQLINKSFKYTKDGVHLTKKGYKVLAKKIKQEIH